MKKISVIVIVSIVLAGIYLIPRAMSSTPRRPHVKIYWLMIDGLAVHSQLAEMPHLKKLLERGTSGRQVWRGPDVASWPSSIGGLLSQRGLSLATVGVSREEIPSAKWTIAAPGGRLPSKLLVGDQGELYDRMAEKPSFSPKKLFKFQQGERWYFAVVLDSTDNKKIDYDGVLFFSGRDATVNTNRMLKDGWSDWIIDDQIRAEPLRVRYHLISIEPDGRFEARLIFDQLREDSTSPAALADKLVENLGPLPDFAGGEIIPPHTPAAVKDSFWQQAALALEWHSRLVSHLILSFSPEAVIHRINSPWGSGEAQEAWYKKVDLLVGHILDETDEDSLIVVSSGTDGLSSSRETPFFIAGPGIEKVSASLKTHDVLSLVQKILSENPAVTPRSESGGVPPPGREYTILNFIFKPCEVFSSEGKSLHRTLLGRYCTPIPGGLMYTENMGISLVDAHDNLIWQRKDMTAHHMISTDEDHNALFPSWDLVPEGGQRVRHNRVAIVNPKGEVLFNWKEIEHHADLEKALKRPVVRYVSTSADFEYLYLNINGATWIPDNALASRYPAFRKGNILVSEEDGGLFILDRQTAQIVFAINLQHTFGFMGLHSATVLASGHILLYKNNDQQEGHPHIRTRVMELDPINMDTTWFYAGTEDMNLNNNHYSSAYKLEGDRILVTDTEKNRVFEVNHDKKVIWEMTYSDGSRHPEKVFSAKKFSAELVEPFLSENRGEL